RQLGAAVDAVQDLQRSGPVCVAGGEAAAQLERECGAVDDLAPATRVARLRHPGLPVDDRLLERRQGRALGQWLSAVGRVLEHEAGALAGDEVELGSGSGGRGLKLDP